jgi:hypothetical protein
LIDFIKLSFPKSNIDLQQVIRGPRNDVNVFGVFFNGRMLQCYDSQSTKQDSQEFCAISDILTRRESQ